MLHMLSDLQRIDLQITFFSHCQIQLEVIYLSSMLFAGRVSF